MPKANFVWRDKITDAPMGGTMRVRAMSERDGNWWQASDTSALSVVTTKDWVVPGTGDDAGNLIVYLPPSGHDEFYECWLVAYGRGESLHRFTAPANDPSDPELTFNVFDPRYSYKTPDPVQDARFA